MEKEGKKESEKESIVLIFYSSIRISYARTGEGGDSDERREVSGRIRLRSKLFIRCSFFSSFTVNQ